MKVIDSFTGRYRFLSNFYPSTIRIPNSDWEYPTVEHYFQAHKTPKHSEAHKRIQLATSPSQAKRLGKHLKIRLDWDEVKVGVMLAGLNYKFKHHLDLQELLLDTEDSILIEGNDWGDTFWGCIQPSESTPPHDQSWVGLNMLGTLLMHVRQTLRGGFDTRASTIVGDY